MQSSIGGPNDTVLKIHRERQQAQYACGPLPAPMWTYSDPTAALQQRGLTPQVLRQELALIHAKSGEAMQGYQNRLPMVLALFVAVPVTLILAMVLFQYIEWWGFVLCGLCGLLAIICCFKVTGSMQRELNPRYESIKQYIECDLNAKYNQRGIYWCIAEKAIWVKGRAMGQTGRRHVVKSQILYHILISPAQQQIVAMPQQVVYVDQNGSPINPNHVQYVVVQQNVR
mmetsp:Transcript_31822/g.51162  ORF Transcript_31822/g.51162 Transcript_31822/m.51162 type:complete len:228 (-) Transcript_31822:204-887(-)|eukprot:CAMPEP_0197030562 /NCGR_PEP_ID=MMETSP1384-20130603/9780_1 /TAXON_ID=29189 /ORGANISM="Ammonia sp." /LENGTH=227 /DNA_ID=CAMNT_0042459943 /DNA_START=30 /DNA_END=713 /DNA_ORIENTATION=+